MGQTVVEKIAQLHMADGPKRNLRAGDFLSIRPRHVLTHDNTSAVLKKFKGIRASKVKNSRQPVFALDHDIQNTAEDNIKKYKAIEKFALEQKIDFYVAGTGIGHQLMVERGYVVPGSLVVASDSHSNMYGALGAIGTPVVRTDAAAIWATGEFWWSIPRTIQVVFDGKLQPGVSGKDVIITLCGLYNRDQVLNAALEFNGAGVHTLTIHERLSIANMSTEWGALTAWFPIDQVTISYLRQRHAIHRWQGTERFSEDDLLRWARAPIAPDKDAQYAARIELNLAEVTPHVSGPDTVQVMHSVAEMEAVKIPIQKAYLLSCVNSRLSDLDAAARVLEGKKIAEGVHFYVAPASQQVQLDAEKRGVWKTLLDAGATTLPAGCGPCIGLGIGLLEPGEVGISATNRNFKGRMGSRDAQCYLASPEVVAASALAGYIAGPVKFAAAEPQLRFTEFTLKASAAENVTILEGFPASLKGRLVFLPQDNLNTDGIYGKDYTYREDMTPAMMADVVMQNYDPAFASRTSAGDVVVGGFNFGTGSSREQAVTALKAKGIPVVIAGSFSQTYLRNAFNNGFLCIETPEFVAKMKASFAKAVANGDKTIIPGDEIEIDFAASTLRYSGETFAFPTLGSVAQSLIVAGGVENLVAQRLGLTTEAAAAK
jgi:homoaconitate hydratase